MRVLVIGGNRFFGKRLVTKLLGEGHAVTLLNRGQTADPFGTQVERIRLDRRELQADHPALGTQRWDLIYDQVCYEAPEALGACQAFHGRTSRYVFISSQSVYGAGAALTESAFDPLAHAFDTPADRNLDYAEAKRQCEAIFFRVATMPVTAVRFPIVLGEDDYTERLKFHVERVKRGQPLYFPNPKARLSFIHSADAANFLLALATTPITGPLNVCSPDPISLESLLTRIEAQLGQKTKWAKRPEDGESSPFGISDDWFMSVEKLTSQAPTPRPLDTWLPGLIAALAG